MRNLENEKKTSNYDLQVDIAKKIFMEYDQKLLIRKFHLLADETWIYLKYLNAPYRINRMDGRVEENLQGCGFFECRSYDTVMTLYDLLCYSKGETMPILFQKWHTINSLSIGRSPDAGRFTKSYAQIFQKYKKELKTACESLGGVIQKPMARADLTCLIPVTSFFPVMLQFWEEDEEYAPQLMILWDENYSSFLHFETTFYLQGDLLERLKKILEAQEKNN